MKGWPFQSAIVIMLFGAFLVPSVVHAAKGTPDSPEFGFGARLDLEGQQVAEAIQSASLINLDWIAVDFDWAAQWPEASSKPDLHLLDRAIDQAQVNGLAVMLSLHNAPVWARTPLGPDPEQTAWFIVNLVKEYPHSIQAIELFPGANTLSGWGSEPDPSAYTDLLKTVQRELIENSSPILLIAGGLMPLPQKHPAEDMDDATFLQSMYAAGAAEVMPVVSLNLAEVTGDPLQHPSHQEHRLLRHYEEIRQVMLSNNHPAGILWVTNLAAPSGGIQNSDVSYHYPEQQAGWLSQAYLQLRAQLYIGVVFYTRLNPSSPSGDDTISLIGMENNTHPFFSLLEKMIAQNNQKADRTHEYNDTQHKRITKARP